MKNDLEIFKATVAYINNECKTLKNHGGNAKCTTDRCYGVLMFTLNHLVGYDSVLGKSLSLWWEKEVLPNLQKLY